MKRYCRKVLSYRQWREEEIQVRVRGEDGRQGWEWGKIKWGEEDLGSDFDQCCARE